MVPCWEASPKLEYGARTIRGKITKLLPEFLTEFPPVDIHPHSSTKTAKVGLTHSVVCFCMRLMQVIESYTRGAVPTQLDY